ncbi:MAG TPA: thiamine pyrophosphate-binding protein [Candidatus Limnocylindrales bacterium]|nr:thiamine pyrophosphate-binding protein [Candidatus Limnocylindrales bacterium]
MSHAGDLLAELLVGYGVTHVFGQPGGQTAALYDGLARRMASIKHTLVRDERSAAYAADAFARLTGRPGVCDVTVGPGTTKLADGLVESLNASVPVIALVGELPRDWAPYREKGVASQGFDQVRFLDAITKATLAVPSLAAMPQMVRSAFRLATTGRPGPVALVIPHDVLDADWHDDDAAVEVDERYARAPAYRPVASGDSITAAADLLNRSRRPVIVAGGGVHASGAAAQLRELIERTGAMVVTSFSGKGSYPETASHAAGVLNPLGPLESLEIVRRADVVFWVGCKVGQNTSHNWTLPLAEQATIQLDLDGSEIGRTFRPTVALNGDALTTLEALNLQVESGARASWQREAARIKGDAETERAALEASESVPIQPPRVIRELAARLSEGDVVVSDASFSAGWIATHIRARRAGRDFIFARGQGGLGYSVPGAIGAAAARPEVRVVTVSGDGGFSYAIGELATHAQQRLRTVNIVLNNGTLAWLAIWQKLFFEGLRQSVDLTTAAGPPDFAAAAMALGCEGIRVEQPSELADAMAAAFDSTRPVVVDVRSDPTATPVHSYRRRLEEGKSYPRPGTVYQLPPWRRSPDQPPESSGGLDGKTVRR